VEVADHLRVTGSVVARQAADRIYIVVANPRDPDRVGIFVGKWRTLEGALPGGRLYDSAARLRRVESVDEEPRSFFVRCSRAQHSLENRK